MKLIGTSYMFDAYVLYAVLIQESIHILGKGCYETLVNKEVLIFFFGQMSGRYFLSYSL